MISPLLVRHPAPYATESLVGYALRLSEKNGYVSPWGLCQLAGLRQRELQTTGIGIEKLGAIANCATSELAKIAFTSTHNRRLHALLGHRLTPTDLNMIQPKICTLCVAEKGFIEAHWHLKLMVACPVHHCLAASRCPACAKPLRWFRTGLLECECGGNLLESEIVAVSQSEAALLDLLRKKTLGESASKDIHTSFPQKDLMAMKLRSMLIVVRVLAKYRGIAEGSTLLTTEWEIIQAASRVLMNWPLNFITLLKDLGQMLPVDVAGGVGKQFGGIYRALFRNKAIEGRHTDFLRMAFLDFAMNHWGRGYVDHKLMKEMKDVLPTRFLSQTEFAARIGVRQVTAAKLLKNPRLSATSVKCGKSKRILVDINLSAIPSTAPGKIFGKREAAKYLEISISVLQALKEEGIYEINNLLPTRAGFHELDLKAFSQKLITLAPITSSQKPSSIANITLREILCGRHDNTATKLKFLRALLAKEIASVGNINGTVGGLQIGKSEYREVLFAERLRTARTKDCANEATANIQTIRLSAKTVARDFQQLTRTGD
jgi:hypothetical protein